MAYTPGHHLPIMLHVHLVKFCDVCGYGMGALLAEVLIACHAQVKNSLLPNALGDS